jgi:hypothetical protein
MKKHILMLSMLLLLTYPAYSDEQNIRIDPSGNHGYVLTPEMAMMSQKCKISVSPKLEALGVVQYLADDPVILKKNYDESNTRYAADIEEYFSSYKEEPVVRLYKKMRDDGFKFGRIPELTLRMDSAFNLKEDVPDFDDYLRTIGGDKTTLTVFLYLLSDFCFKTNFNLFFDNHREYYKNIISFTKNKVDKLGFIEKLISYYGYEQNSYNIVLYPLSVGGFATRLKAENNRLDVYDFMCLPEKDIKFSSLLIHEFGHSYTNPLTYDKYANELAKYENLYQPIENKVKRQYYPNWTECVSEHIVRAVTNRILLEMFGNDVSEDDMNYQLKCGFIYLIPLCQSLKEYEKRRDKYPKFDDYYPELIKVFRM